MNLIKVNLWKFSLEINANFVNCVRSKNYKFLEDEC